MTALIVLRLI